jgi:clan AA aspartic protease (TIGR02281 family)
VVPAASPLIHAGWVAVAVSCLILGVTGGMFRRDAPGSLPRSSDDPQSLAGNASALKRVAGHIDGHGKCHIAGWFEGEQFLAVFDTGADGLYFFRDHARRLGYDPAHLHFSKKIGSAHGSGMAAPIVLHEVRLGHGLVLHDVPALIGDVDGVPGNDDPLLGPSAVGNLHHFEIGPGACALFWQ